MFPSAIKQACLSTVYVDSKPADAAFKPCDYCSRGLFSDHVRTGQDLINPVTALRVAAFCSVNKAS